MAGEDFSKVHKRKIPVLIDDCVQCECSADELHNLKLLFVKRVAVEVAVDRSGVRHESGAVKRRNRLRVSQPGSDDLPAARVTGHEVRLDQSCRDPQVRFDEPAVNPHNRAAGFRAPQIDMSLVVSRKMVFDAGIFEHPGITDQFGKFFAFVRSMKAGCDQYSNSVLGNSGGQQSLDHRSQKKMIRNRPSDIANGDAGRVRSASQFG